MVIGILLAISVLANIFLFGMLAFLLGQRKKEKEWGTQVKKLASNYIDSAIGRVGDKEVQEKLADMTKGFGDEKNKH